MKTIYLCDISNFNAEIDYSEFDLVRKNYIDKIKSIKSKNQSIIAWKLLIYVLKSHFNMDNFDFENDNGKFFLKNGALCFSISHSHNLVAVCFDKEDCAIDLEKIDDRLLKLKRKIDSLKVKYNENPNFTLTENLACKWTHYECLFKAKKNLAIFSRKISDKLGNNYILSSTKNVDDVDFISIFSIV